MLVDTLHFSSFLKSYFIVVLFPINVCPYGFVGGDGEFY
jgi:hypothetical protein